MELETEQQQLEAIRQGDKDAFRALVNPLIAKSYRSALAILGSRQLAEEAVQNTLIEAYSTIMSGREIRRFPGWFSRVVANRSIDVARKEQPYKHSLDIEDQIIRDPGSSPLEDLLRKENSQRVIEAVLALKLQQRMVVVLYYFQELSIEEIAEMLGLKAGTVKSRLYHARLKLSRDLHLTRPQTKEIMI